MTSSNKNTNVEDEGIKYTKKKSTIDITKLYSGSVDDVEICIDDEHYSNLSFIQLSHRDVYIDFLKMPGIIKDGKQVIHGTRIFLGHSAAQQMALVLAKMLKQVNEEGRMEFYDPEFSVGEEVIMDDKD